MAPTTASTATSTKKPATMARYGRRSPRIRRSVPGATLASLTEGSSLNELTPDRPPDPGTTNTYGLLSC